MSSSYGGIAGAWRSFWHTMTSYDRHASHNSPYRTGQHVPLPQNRHAILTSVATDATASQTQLTAAAQEPPDPADASNSASAAPYSPGMRTTMQRRRSDDTAKTVPKIATGEIQMQNFNDGLPPPPPIGHSWKRIDRWCEDNYEELFDNICEGCTQNDINELEHELDCTLPMDVHESLKMHDGQERGGLPTGIVFGCMLLDCEEIVQEWRNWRTVTEEILSRPMDAPQSSPRSKASSGVASSSTAQQPKQMLGPTWIEDLQARQDSQPPNAVQKVYAHPAWIPLARDWGGNCLAVDLAPGPTGKWGQVIIMGRDYDCKYVVARSWAAFMATLADDLSSPKVSVNEESGELKLLEFKHQGVEPAYLDILRWRADQKYGRKPPRRRLTGEMRINPAAAVAAASSTAKISPYASPVKSNADRRDGSPQRLSVHRKGSAGINSPRGPISSPLARVAEESPLAFNAQSLAEEPITSIDSAATSDSTETSGTHTNSTIRTSLGSNKENTRPPTSILDGLGMKNVNLENHRSTTSATNTSAANDEDGEMKTIEI